MSGAHAVISPSGAARLVQCPASVLMERQFPETEQSPDAAEGEASHWAGAEMLAGRLVDEGMRAPNGVLLTQEMVEGADLYYDDIVRSLQPFGMTPADGAIESAIAVSRVHPECWGTPDFRVWIPGHLRGGRPQLKLWDYKFGHRFIEVFENWQLVVYAAGCIEGTNLTDLDLDVEVTIVQPRSFHREGPVRRWAFPASAMRAQVTVVSNSAHEALAGNARTRVGPECRDCRARHACPALQRAAQDACDVAGQAQPFALPPEALGVELRYLTRAEELLKARISGLQEQALSLQRSGQRVPHWTVEHGVGRRRWKKPAGEVLALGKMFGIDLAKPTEVITPVQAVERGLPEMLLTEFTDAPCGAAALVPDTGAKARAIFGGQT